MKINFSTKGIIFRNGIIVSWLMVSALIFSTTVAVYVLIIQAKNKKQASDTLTGPANITADSINNQNQSGSSSSNSKMKSSKNDGAFGSSGSSRGEGNSGSPATNTSALYVAYGDTRTNHAIHQQIVNLIVSRNPVIVLHTGDLVEDGNIAEQWTTFNSIAASILTRIYPVLGNHENNSVLYYNNFTLPGNEEWYTLSSSYFNIIALDSNTAIGAGSEQYNWLVSTLQATDKNKLTIVYFHHPPYGTGKAEVDPQGLRSSIVPLFEQNGVDLVLNGDHHDYERSLANGIYYIVVGGGGAPLNTQAISSPYSQLFLSSYNYSTFYASGGKIHFVVYNQDNSQIDQVTIVNR